MWDPKCDMNECVYETETDSQMQRTDVLAGEAGGQGLDWEFGISRCKLLYIEKQHGLTV